MVKGHHLHAPIRMDKIGPAVANMDQVRAAPTQRECGESRGTVGHRFTSRLRIQPAVVGDQRGLHRPRRTERIGHGVESLNQRADCKFGRSAPLFPARYSVGQRGQNAVARALGRAAKMNAAEILVPARGPIRLAKPAAATSSPLSRIPVSHPSRVQARRPPA